jgi:uncharacterized protein YoxC
VAPSDSEFAPNIMGSFRRGVDLVEKGLEGIRREWDALLGRINALLKRIEQHLNNDSIWATISEWWTEKIADAVKKLHEVVEEIRQKVGKILESVQKAVAGSVPVASLFEVGLNYATKVNTPLSEIGNDMTGSGNIDAWRGPTKETYEKRVRDQIDAVNASVGKVKATSKWLADVAAANTGYMVELGERAAEIVGALATTLIDATETSAGVITQAVITLQHLSELIGTAVTQTLQYALNLAKRLGEVMVQITELAGEYGDHSGNLSGGRWPQSVAG